MPGGDAQGEVNRYLASSLLALAEVLEREHGLDRDAAVTLARAAFLANGRGLMRAATLIWLRLTPDPFAALLKLGPGPRMARLWGRGMEAEEVHAPGQITLRVTGCAFAAYFWNAGRSDLTPILCAYDAQWFAWINGAQQGLRARRDGTLAEGLGACTFLFEAVPEPAEQGVPRPRPRDGDLRP
ncbi:L-2-amino-thiazoline-4-carboxylic acid hydrolase [Gymnodinialimonas ulvae]|uniref:L-2-amino-thiazoline-4-carboxylic acid hydrolase n=1 Tax=Gymnodinialimonas ulvae TaxID=3126504 RepID=UPI0030EF4231